MMDCKLQIRAKLQWFKTWATSELSGLYVVDFCPSSFLPNWVECLGQVFRIESGVSFASGVFFVRFCFAARCFVCIRCPVSLSLPFREASDRLRRMLMNSLSLCAACCVEILCQFWGKRLASMSSHNKGFTVVDSQYRFRENSFTVFHESSAGLINTYKYLMCWTQDNSFFSSLTFFQEYNR